LKALEPLYAVMNSTLGVVFKIGGEHSYMVGIFIISTLVSLFITLVTSRVVDREKMRRIRERMPQLQEKLKEAQREKDSKKMVKINREMLELQREMMANAFKPMLYTMLPLLLLFSWLRYIMPQNTPVVHLPFELPFYGTTLGWLGWYILSSLLVSPVLKKLLNAEF